MTPHLTLPLAAFLTSALAACATVGSVPRTAADDPSVPQVVVDGVRLHLEAFGDPGLPPVVVIHGGPGRDFRHLLALAALQNEFRVVFYDQRGTGLSERVPDERHTLEAYYRELDAVVDLAGGGRKVHLVGHSWGAMLASGYLGLHPEKVAGAVLAEPGMLTPETARIFMAATNGMSPRFGWGMIAAGTRAFFATLWVSGPDEDARRDALLGALVDSPFDGNPTAGYYCGRDLRTARLDTWRVGARAAPALFREARRPDGSWDVDFVRGVELWPGTVLFLAGGCDEVIGEAQQRRHMASFPRAELVVIPGAGHTMFGEKPEESVAAVRRYLRQAGAAAVAGR